MEPLNENNKDGDNNSCDISPEDGSAVVFCIFNFRALDYPFAVKMVDVLTKDMSLPSIENFYTSIYIFHTSYTYYLQSKIALVAPIVSIELHRPR